MRWFSCLEAPTLSRASVNISLHKWRHVSPFNEYTSLDFMRNKRCHKIFLLVLLWQKWGSEVFVTNQKVFRILRRLTRFRNIYVGCRVQEYYLIWYLQGPAQYFGKINKQEFLTFLTVDQAVLIVEICLLSWIHLGY